jgi:tetratricopeptide (TPR) repeat protein
MNETGVKLFKKALKEIKNSNHQEAISILDQIIKNDNPFYSIISPDMQKLNEWKYYDEITKCEKAICNGHQKIDSCLALSLIHKLTGNFERREKFLKMALEILKDNNSWEEDARIYRELAETKYHLGKIEKALMLFQKAVLNNQNDYISLEGMGLCYYYLDLPTKAIKPLERALERIPENHLILNRLAFIYSELGEIEKAKPMIKKAIELDNGNIVYWDTYACILFLEKNYTESLKIFEKIMNSNPDEGIVSWHILMHLYEELGMKGRARVIEQKIMKD